MLTPEQIEAMEAAQESTNEKKHHKFISRNYKSVSQQNAVNPTPAAQVKPGQAKPVKSKSFTTQVNQKGRIHKNKLNSKPC